MHREVRLTDWCDEQVRRTQPRRPSTSTTPPPNPACTGVLHTPMRNHPEPLTQRCTRPTSNAANNAPLTGVEVTVYTPAPSTGGRAYAIRPNGLAAACCWSGKAQPLRMRAAPPPPTAPGHGSPARQMVSVAVAARQPPTAVGRSLRRQTPPIPASSGVSSLCVGPPNRLPKPAARTTTAGAGCNGL